MILLSTLNYLEMTRIVKNRKKVKSKNKGSKKGDGLSSSSPMPTVPVKVWQPGVDKLEEGEELQCDPSAYNTLHDYHVGWPCLSVANQKENLLKVFGPCFHLCLASVHGGSFDIVRDTLGLVRTEFPHTVYFMAGTQAERACWNSIGIFKVSNVSERDMS